MNLETFLNEKISGKKLIEKFHIITTTKILWVLNDEANKKEALDFLNELQKTVKKYTSNLNIEFGVIENCEEEKIITHE